MKIRLDMKWVLGFVVAVAMLFIAYQQIQIAWKEYENKLDPILNAEFNISGNKCDLVITNNGVISINDIQVKLLPRLAKAPDFEIISSISARYSWKTVKYLIPEDNIVFPIDEEILKNRVINQVIFYQDRVKDPLFPVLLVNITYRRSSDNKLFSRQKYLFVAEDTKTKKPIPFDLDEAHHQQFIDLRKSLREFDKEILGSRK